ncbi:MAG: helix-turn-helix domain-containing protein [Acidimicrobiia bacterium]
MRRLSEVERSEIWDRFEAGESLRSIIRRLGRPPSTIRTHVVSLQGSGGRSICADLAHLRKRAIARRSGDLRGAFWSQG